MLLCAATHLDNFSSQNWNTLGNPVTDAAGRSRKKLCLGTHKKIFLAASSSRLDRPCRGRRGLRWHCFLYLKGTIIGEMLKHNFCRYHEAESIRCSLHYVLKSWKSVKYSEIIDRYLYKLVGRINSYLKLPIRNMVSVTWSVTISGGIHHKIFHF